MKKIDGLQKHTLQLFEGDFARLQETHPELGAAAVIRKLVQNYLAKANPPIKVGRLNLKEPDL